MSNIYWDIETNGLLNKIDEKRITCIGLLHNDLGVRIFSGKDEAKLIQDFFDFIDEECKGDTWVSYNGISFDVPFVCLRAIANDLTLPSCFHKAIHERGKPDYIMDNHVDLMLVIYPHFAEIVRATGTGRMTKDSARNFFNIYEPRAGSAQHCLLIARDENWSPILMHNSMDLFTTESLYLACVGRMWCK